MLKLSSYLTGEDYRLLSEDTPASRKKVMALASALFVPVILWFISTFLLCRNVMECTVGNSLLSAGIAAIMIFLLERNIIMAKNNWVIAFFRIFLGFLIATLGSLSIDEVMFKSDIDQQMAFIKEEMKTNSEKEIGVNYQPQIDQLVSVVDVKHGLWQEAQREASMEADGRGGSGIRGVNGITRIKMEIADERKADYLQEKQRIDHLQADKAVEIQKSKDQFDASFNNKALLFRIKAMFDLVFSDKFMGLIYMITTLIFFFMEFLVIILKLTWSKTNYEAKVEMIEKIGQKRMQNLEQRDRDYFDSIKLHPDYKRLEKAVKNGRSVSMFN